MTPLDRVDTIVMVMLENRSFDHMLGHLSYGQYANGSEVDGITGPLKRDAYANVFEGEAYYPSPMKDGCCRETSRTIEAPSPSSSTGAG
jgi:phospholipase C